MKQEIVQTGILLLVLAVSTVGVFHTFAGGVSGAKVYDYNACCCTVVPLIDGVPFYDFAVHRQVQAFGASCEIICDEFYSGDSWVYSKEGFCKR